MEYNLTIAICAYNSEKYIEETLQCLLNQTYQKFNLLILNDCCTDNTIKVATEFLNYNGREFEIVHQEENKGLAMGRALVEQYVKSKFLIFVDADDCPLPNFVEKLYYKIKYDDDLIAVGCYLEFIDENSNKIKGGQFLGCTDKESFYQKAKAEKLIFQASNAIFNREAALKVGGRNITGFPLGKPRYQDLCEDLDLWTRMSDLYAEGKAIIVIPEVLFQYRKHNQSMSASNINMFIRMRHIKKNLKLRRRGLKELSFIDFYRSLTDSELNDIKSQVENNDNLRKGVTNMARGNIISGFMLVMKSICTNPGYFIQKLKANTHLFK